MATGGMVTPAAPADAAIIIIIRGDMVTITVDGLAFIMADAAGVLARGLIPIAVVAVAAGIVGAAVGRVVVGATVVTTITGFVTRAAEQTTLN